MKMTATLAALFLCSCAATTTERRGLPPLSTVPKVELPRYLGVWYEIASFPQSFQKGCTGSTARYALRDDGDIDVLNRCFLDSLDGPQKASHGRARVVDTVTNAKLKVSFFRPFWGEYWVIDLGADYDYAVVGHPSRDYLWVLSREPTMAPERYDEIVKRLEAQGYETARLQRTPQKPQAGLSQR